MKSSSEDNPKTEYGLVFVYYLDPDIEKWKIFYEKHEESFKFSMYAKPTPHGILWSCKTTLKMEYCKEVEFTFKHGDQIYEFIDLILASNFANFNKWIKIGLIIVRNEIFEEQRDV